MFFPGSAKKIAGLVLVSLDIKKFVARVAIPLKQKKKEVDKEDYAKTTQITEIR